MPLHIWLPDGPPGGAQQHLRADVRHRDQDRHLRHGAGLLRFLRPPPRLGRTAGAGRRRGLARCSACSTRCMEHDLKRLLAYHSIENIGIILIGFGAALVFRASDHPTLAAIALIAGLYHTLNHAIFKCLLFLGAGSVLQATRTRNMEEMGGLIRRMPATALFFLIGAVAISGLPPLNGFVSEWLTYQALLAGFGTTQSSDPPGVPDRRRAAGLDRRAGRSLLREGFRHLVPGAAPQRKRCRMPRRWRSPCASAWGSWPPAVSCSGLGATWFLPVFDPITQQAIGSPTQPDPRRGQRLRAEAGTARAGTVSTAGIAAMLVLLSAAARAILVRLGPRSASARRDPPGIAACRVSPPRTNTPPPDSPSPSA